MTKQLCTFEQITERIDGKAHFRCTACGFVVYHCRSVPEKIFAKCGRPARNAPTMLEMMASAASAAAGFVASGGKRVPDEVFTVRAAICKECPAHEPGLNRCGECGCFLSLKAWLPKEKCPLDKWPK